jgi:hypothetical protein
MFKHNTTKLSDIHRIDELIRAMEERFNTLSERFEQRLKLAEEHIKELEISQASEDIVRRIERLEHSQANSSEPEHIQWLRNKKANMSNTKPPWMRMENKIEEKERIIDALIEKGYFTIHQDERLTERLDEDQLKGVVSTINGISFSENITNPNQPWTIIYHTIKRPKTHGYSIVDKNYLLSLKYEFRRDSSTNNHREEIIYFPEHNWTIHTYHEAFKNMASKFEIKTTYTKNDFKR